MRHIRITFAVTLILLGGCVSSRISDAARNGLGRTGVISLLGDTFHGSYSGTTVFNDRSYDANVASWSIDQDTSEYVRAELVAKGIRAEDLIVSPAAREAFHGDDKGEFYGADGKVQSNYDELCRTALRQGYDTLVIITGAQVANQYGPPLKPGYGLFVRAVLGITSRFPYAQFMIRVVDLKTEKQLARVLSQATEARPSETIPWKDDFEGYSAEEQVALKSAVESHIRREVDRMLVQLNLRSASVEAEGMRRQMYAGQTPESVGRTEIRCRHCSGE